MREKKEHIVARLSDKLKKAHIIVCANYQGMKHQQLEALKRALKPVEAELTVTKNTLLSLSLSQNNLELKEELQGQTITLFAYGDPVLPLKELAKTIKALNMPVIKFGILDGKTIGADQVQKLATLPPREILVAQLLGQMKGPIAGLHRALSWNMQKLVLTLSAVQKVKVQ